MIGDGEPHRSVGEVFDWFAIEFWSENPLTLVPRVTGSAKPCGEYHYGVTAEVIFIVEKKAVVIDFGLMAIGNTNNFASNVHLGDFVAGEISIGLPLCIEPIPEELITRMGRQWKVAGISADLTPYRNGTRDCTQVAYKEVTSTEETRAFDYVLHCKELGPSKPRDAAMLESTAFAALESLAEAPPEKALPIIQEFLRTEKNPKLLEKAVSVAARLKGSAKD